MADVFLSYARANAAAAARIAKVLEASGRAVWYDPEIPAHRTYADVIASELECAKAVLVLWSKSSVESQWVRSEANRARELGKLVQARLEPARLPMPFDQIQCADLEKWRRGRAHRGWSQVVRSIDALIEGISSVRERPQAPADTSLLARRSVLVGVAATVSIAAGGTGWWIMHRGNPGPKVPAATLSLMQQAKGALWQNTPEGQNQALAIYRQIIAENPTYADAWGRLAMGYALTAHWRAASESQILRARARSAAQQALSLDPNDSHALIALAFAKPFLGNWLSIEKDLRRVLKLWPKDGEANFSLAMVLSMTGQNRAALAHVTSMLPDGPTPGMYVFHAQMLWSAGREDELDALLDEATKLYPTHFGVWFTRFYTRMMGGRPEAALAMAADTTDRPTGIDPEEINAVVRVAKAVESGSQVDVDAVTREWMERAHHGAGYAENAAQFMSSLRRLDEAFTVLRAYYFSEGFDCGEVRFSPAMASYTPSNDRQTGFLFNPALAPLRRDPRFGSLIARLGLKDYWRSSGHLPDYLAGSPA